VTWRWIAVRVQRAALVRVSDCNPVHASLEEKLKLKLASAAGSKNLLVTEKATVNQNETGSSVYLF
jgi:hypothetical protein